jgi:D-glycero-alpha-D-manno-heptose-7-phosphate kinase
MIISRTPVRMSFVGGGSDLPGFYREHGGAVLSTALDKYVYVTINRKFDDAVRVSYSVTEEVHSAAEVKHKLVREVLKKLDILGGVEITSVADIPSKGTGLGSSSAFGVGLLNALSAYQGKHVSSEELARVCCEVEIDILGEPIGKQDQYACALGGLNLIEFQQDDSVRVTPVVCKKETIRDLMAGIQVFYTGITRSASEVLRKQDQAVVANVSKQEVLKQMVALAYRMHGELIQNRLGEIGEILHENWELKRSLTDGISTMEIDDWYAKARAAGASGGKLLGAGSGGFLMFFSPPERHEAIAKALEGLRSVPFGMDHEGSRIIFVGRSADN